MRIKGVDVKKLFLTVFFALIIVSPANAQSTLALQEKCAEGALKYYREAIVPYLESKDKVGILYHYNKKLDRCFIRVSYIQENHVESIYDVYENRLIATFVKSQGIWSIEDKFFFLIRRNIFLN